MSLDFPSLMKQRFDFKRRYNFEIENLNFDVVMGLVEVINEEIKEKEKAIEAQREKIAREKIVNDTQRKFRELGRRT